MRREEPIPALSAGLSQVVLTGLLLALALPARPPRPAAPLLAPVAVPEPPRPDVVAKPATAPPPEDGAAGAIKEEWPEHEVMLAREQCMHVLSSVAADVEWLPPVKNGSCGLPAPLKLKSVGAGPEIVFDPPVHVNCRMVAALGQWAKSSLQPEAKARFQSQVVRIVGASGYSCRNIYNLPNARLSQHALANAIDIGGFRLADGRVVGILKGWGLTERDVKAQAKAKAAADARAKAQSAEKGAKEARAAGGREKGKPAPGKTAGEEAAGRSVTKASLTSPSAPALGKAPDARGAVAAQAAPGQQTPTREAQFLRAIHKGACGPFGTVLGPEANDPHRNHFHLDLIPRRGRGYCE